MRPKSNKHSRNTLFASVVALALVTSGCILEVGGSSDLEVVWSIDGRTSTALCQSYGIDHFVVDAYGPQWTEVTVDCGAWDSADTLHWLEAGWYDVTVEARDAAGNKLAQLAQSIDLYPDWNATTLWFDFVRTDFAKTRPAADDQATETTETTETTEPETNDPEDADPQAKKLNVTWTVNGQLAGDAQQCAELGIGSWELTLTGAEQRTVKSICGEHDWSTGDELHNLSAGAYQVSLRTYDASGNAIGAPQTRDLSLDADDPVVDLTIQLSL